MDHRGPWARLSVQRSHVGLNLLSLGDDVARGLGVNLAVTRWTGLVAITLLAGAATAACGPIAFVGLVVPHVCRVVTGPTTAG